jgi:hypothetical protein
LRDDDGNWGKAICGRWIGTGGSGDFKPTKRQRDDRIGFCHSEQPYHDRITGRYDGGSCGGEGNIEFAEVDHLWAQAVNATHWRASYLP